jgi:hypothetical protein
MWVPGGLFYLGAIIGTFARWQSDADGEGEPFAPRAAVPSSSGEGV